MGTPPIIPLQERTIVEIDSYEHALRMSEYILRMRPVFNAAAVFSDETESFVAPMEPDPGDEVTIRIRTAHNNVDNVYLISGPMKEPLTFDKTEGSFDYYRIRVRMDEKIFRYFFEIRSGKMKFFYNKLGITTDLSEAYAFAIKPGFHTPQWARGAVMYQILMDRFNNGDTDNDVLDDEYSYIGEHCRRVTDWGKRPASMGVREFYGGDIEGVMQKLDYLQDLGIQVIYFNPLFVSPSNHKYDIQDYDHIDPHFATLVVDEGSLLPDWSNDNSQAQRYICRVTRRENLNLANSMFAALVEECHRRGIRVIIDGVFNHCGSFNKWMDRERIYEKQSGYEKGAYVDANSPYRSFFHFTNEHEWPYNPYYSGWWGHDTLPKLNYEDSDSLENYILDIATKWVSPPFNVDGWRLDVAADLGSSSEYNHKFWKKFRKAVKTANPDAIILAEHYGSPAAWLQGDEWDTVMNYDAFMEPLTWFFTGMEKHSDDFREDMLGNGTSFVDAMRYHMAELMAPSLQTSMNELSNHDHSRFLTRTNHKAGRMDHFDYDAASDGVNPAVMREAVVMQMTWPGAPTLYYGDEAGVCGFTDPDNRRTYPWGHEDKHMVVFHKDIIHMHLKYQSLRRGSLVMLHSDYNVLAYGRFGFGEHVVVMFNNNDSDREIEVNVMPAGVEDGTVLRTIFSTSEYGYSQTGEEYTVADGKIKVVLPKTSSLVLFALGEDA